MNNLSLLSNRIWAEATVTQNTATSPNSSTLAVTLKMRVFLIILLSVSLFSARSQPFAWTKLQVGKVQASEFGFTRLWDYSDTIYQSDSGFRYAASGVLAQPVDTAHLFYTALMQSNTGLDDSLIYTDAKWKVDTLQLYFHSRTISLGPSLELIMLEDEFRILTIDVPVRTHLKKYLRYEVKSQQVVVDEPIIKGKERRGKLDMLVDQVFRPDFGEPYIHRLYFKGYFIIPAE